LEVKSLEEEIIGRILEESKCCRRILEEMFDDKMLGRIIHWKKNLGRKNNSLEDKMLECKMLEESWKKE